MGRYIALVKAWTRILRVLVYGREYGDCIGRLAGELRETLGFTPWRCPFCGRSFNGPNALIPHLRRGPCGEDLGELVEWILETCRDMRLTANLSGARWAD